MINHYTTIQPTCAAPADNDAAYANASRQRLAWSRRITAGATSTQTGTRT